MENVAQYLPLVGLILLVIGAAIAYYQYSQYQKTYADLRLHDKATLTRKGFTVTIALEEIEGQDFVLAVKKPQYKRPTYHNRRLMPGVPLLDGLATTQASLLITQHPILHNQIRVQLIKYRKN